MADVNALVLAALYGNIGKVRRLLAEGVPVNSLNEVSVLLFILTSVHPQPVESNCEYSENA